MKSVDLILGNIYGGSNHGLIAPLYNPELNLTADPETGFQVLAGAPWIDLDAWIDWQSFIFRDDTHQEAFTVGLSTRFKLNAPSSTFHCYVLIRNTRISISPTKPQHMDSSFQLDILQRIIYKFGLYPESRQ